MDVDVEMEMEMDVEMEMEAEVRVLGGKRVSEICVARDYGQSMRVIIPRTLGTD